MDRYMDRAASGPTWLKDPRIAECVVRSLLQGERDWNLYELFSWVVMPNHVHVLLNPHRKLSEITRPIKKNSAREANVMLGRVGQSFWQDESYDHWVRDAREFDRITSYIESNPISAGLADHSAAWRWSSAWEG